MRNILYPFGISVILVLIFQLFNITDFNEKTKIINEVEGQNNDLPEINRYLNNFNNKVQISIKPEIQPISEVFTGMQTAGLINSNDFAQFFSIGKGNDTNLLKDPDISWMIRHKLKISDKTGYIKLSQIKRGSYQSFMRSMELHAGKTGFDTLYLDLRDCNMGDDREAVMIANQLVFDSDITLMKEMFFNGSVNTIKSRGKVFFPLKKIIILTNTVTSGVAEMLIRMLKTGVNTTIIGANTGGNSLIKRFYPLTSGHYVYLTIGYYCRECEEPDSAYDQTKLRPVIPEIKMDKDQINELLNAKFKPNHAISQ